MTASCGICGQPMPPGEDMFKYHGYSGPCPKAPLGPIIGVHGFNFDPASKRDNPKALYAQWSEMLGEFVDGLAWYSSTPTLTGILRTLGGFYFNRYAYAYERLTVAASRALADKITATPGRVRIVCHSLGSRVTGLALRRLPASKVERILILDGAELQSEMQDAFAIPSPPPVLNICVRHDRVLRDLGSWASGTDGHCVGFAGIGPKSPPGWRDVFLDDADTIKRARLAYEWGLNAVDPLDLLGHWESYRIQANWPLYCRFMRGQDISKLFEVQSDAPQSRPLPVH